MAAILHDAVEAGPFALMRYGLACRAPRKLRIFIIFHDFPSFSMIFHDFSWFSMIFHDFHDFSWFSYSWFSMIFDGFHIHDFP